MSNYTVSAKEQKKAESIRGHYTSLSNSKFEQLRALDTKVRRPGMIIGIALCVIGLLIMGAGMATIMTFDRMNVGLILSIPGLIIALSSYPIYKLITKQRKNKYLDQIMQLSNEITR